MTVKDVARAFAAGGSAQCHNSYTDGKSYWLHGNMIAHKQGPVLLFSWCGWYGPTTANHINRILDAYGCDFHVSYAQARDTNSVGFEVIV